MLDQRHRAGALVVGGVCRQGCSFMRRPIASVDARGGLGPGAGVLPRLRAVPRRACAGRPVAEWPAGARGVAVDRGPVGGVAGRPTRSPRASSRRGRAEMPLTSSWTLRNSRRPLPIWRESSGSRCGPTTMQRDDQDEQQLLGSDVEHGGPSESTAGLRSALPRASRSGAVRTRASLPRGRSSAREPPGLLGEPAGRLGRAACRGAPARPGTPTRSTDGQPRVTTSHDERATRSCREVRGRRGCYCPPLLARNSRMYASSSSR